MSPVSGSIFEKRIIEKYVMDNGVDPINGKDLDVDQLIEIKRKFPTTAYSSNIYQLTRTNRYYPNERFILRSRTQTKSTICNLDTMYSKKFTRRVRHGHAELVQSQAKPTRCSFRPLAVTLSARCGLPITAQANERSCWS